MKWLRQAGSPGNDHIAPHGGLAISKNGNVIVFGDTNGAFYRERSESSTSDMFVMEFGKNGLHKRHVRAPIRDDTPVTAPEPAAGPPTVKAEPVQLVPDSTSSNSATESAASGSGNNKISTGVLAGLLVAVTLKLAISLRGRFPALATALRRFPGALRCGTLNVFEIYYPLSSQFGNII